MTDERRAVEIKGCIFDMDGVLVDTAGHHFKAWQAIADELGYHFTEKENEKLKGLSRQDSLSALLKMIGIEKTDEEKDLLCAQKNEIYLDLVKSIGADAILPGVKNLLTELNEQGIKYAVGSASKNARPILKAIELYDTFQAIVDGNDVTYSKPDPEVFLKAAKLLNISPANIVVIEDSLHGVKAAKDGGFLVVGVGNPNILDHADTVFETLSGVSLETILTHLSNNLKSTLCQPHS